MEFENTNDVSKYDKYMVLDTEGDIILGLRKDEEGRMVADIITPNSVENSQLLENLNKLLEKSKSAGHINGEIKKDSKSMSFRPIRKSNGNYKIYLGDTEFLEIDENFVPVDAIETERDGELLGKRKILAVDKINLAQKTDYEPVISEETEAIISSNPTGPEKEEIKTDLHNHLAGLLKANRLIALGIRHNVDYNLGLIHKYGINITPKMKENLADQLMENFGEVSRYRELIEKIKSGEEEKNKILEVISNDWDNKTIPEDALENIVLPFNDIITIPGNLEKISASMRLPIDGQAVFTNLEIVYAARDPFTKVNGRKKDRIGIDTANKPVVPTQDEIDEILEKLENLPSMSVDILEVCDNLIEMKKILAGDMILQDENVRVQVDSRIRNGLQEDMLFWIGVDAKTNGVEYIEASQATLAKTKKGASEMFLEAVASPIGDTGMSILDIIKGTEDEPGLGVDIRFLAAIRRNFDNQKGFDDSAETVIKSAENGCCVGIDFMGEELNETAHFGKTITDISRYAIDMDPDFTIRVHAGENNANDKNIEQVIDFVDEAYIKSYIARKINMDGVELEIPRDAKTGKIDFEKIQEQTGVEVPIINGEFNFKKIEEQTGIKYPQIRIGHGLYGPLNDENLRRRMAERGVIVEFNVTSNVRLNNLQPQEVVSTLKGLIESYADQDPKEPGVGIVLGTDGYGIYGTTSKDEYYIAKNIIQLKPETLERIKETEERVKGRVKARDTRIKEKKGKHKTKYEINRGRTFKTRYTEIEGNEDETRKVERETLEKKLNKTFNTELDLKGKKPIIIAGGSFGEKDVELSDDEKKLIDELIKQAEPEKYTFVIGNSGKGAEGYLLQKLNEIANQGKKVPDVVAVLPQIVIEENPTYVTDKEKEEQDNTFRVLTNDRVTKVIIRGTQREGNSIYKGFEDFIEANPDATVVAFSGEAQVSNLVTVAVKHGAKVYGKNGHESLEKKAEALGNNEKAGEKKGFFRIFGFEKITNLKNEKELTQNDILEVENYELKKSKIIEEIMDKELEENDDSITRISIPKDKLSNLDDNIKRINPFDEIMSCTDDVTVAKVDNCVKTISELATEILKEKNEEEQTFE